MPQVDLEYATIVSDRVTAFSVDQAVGAYPALDQIALSPGSD